MNENTLEDVEAPLRHFFSASDRVLDDDGDYSDNVMLLPTPAPSIRDQTIQINFETPSPHRTIALSLSVDASPGCGGIAWPAGEVRYFQSYVYVMSLMPEVAYCPISIFFFFPSSIFPYNVRRLCKVLASYIARRGSALEGLNVLELGSGTGLVGLVAGYLGARVCITDQAYVIITLSPNCRLRHTDIFTNYDISYPRNNQIKVSRPNNGA